VSFLLQNPIPDASVISAIFPYKGVSVSVVTEEEHPVKKNINANPDKINTLVMIFPSYLISYFFRLYNYIF
jgi:hypothetical protein